MSDLAHDFAEMVGGMPAALSAAVERELRMGFELEVMLAEQRQRRLARFNWRRPRRSIDGIGQTMMSIDPVFRALAERRYGRGCWTDKGFVREALRDNPDLRVPYRTERVSVRVDGRKPSKNAGVQAPAPGEGLILL